MTTTTNLSCWIDCCYSLDDGATWSFLSHVAETGGSNGNPPAMIRMSDGRICCVYANRDRRVLLATFSDDEGRTWVGEQLLRDDHRTVNGAASDSGYARLFQRSDGKLVTAYFWATPERPETHIAATIFRPR